MLAAGGEFRGFVGAGVPAAGGGAGGGVLHPGGVAEVWAAAATAGVAAGGAFLRALEGAALLRVFAQAAAGVDSHGADARGGGGAGQPAGDRAGESRGRGAGGERPVPRSGSADGGGPLRRKSARDRRARVRRADFATVGFGTGWGGGDAEPGSPAALPR